MRFKGISKLFAVLALFLVGAIGCLAQGTDLGTVRGAITDSSGSVVPNADVTITDLATNTMREVTSNAQGNYEVIGLNSGNYKVSVTAPGFGTSAYTYLDQRTTALDQNTGRLLPITDINPNPDFGRLINSFSQEGIDSRRSVRLRLRITF